MMISFHFTVTETLTNKTLMTPTINNATLTLNADLTMKLQMILHLECNT